MLGAGGAARAVVLALARAGAADVAVVNRTRVNADRAAALGRACRAASPTPPTPCPDADLVVNATPLGMTEGGMAVDPTLLRPGQCRGRPDLSPGDHAAAGAAAERGCAVANGLGMLVHQAAHAVRLWTGLEPPVAAMREAAAATALETRQNLDIKYPDY